jgi:hypothetical protein
MSDSSCREVFEGYIPAYQLGSREERRTIFLNVVTLTGYSPKHAIRLLNHGFPEPSGDRGGRLVVYDDEVKHALIKLWRASSCLCSKRLIPFLGELIRSLEYHGHLCISARVRSLLLSMSASTADRLLAEERSRRQRGLGTTKPGNRRLSKLIPVRTHNGPVRQVPGYFEGDLVAHCGHSIRGSFLYTLVMTDLYTEWTDFEPISDRTAPSILAAIERIRERLPMPLLGLDTDNGTEFINEDVYEYCRERQITFERGRPGKKNDQAHVEQKNGSVVRRSLGCDRYEGDAALAALREVYSVLRMHLNYFQPSMKLAAKKRSGDSISRKHDIAKTPLQRLLSSSILGSVEQDQLKAEFARLDPVILLHRLAVAKYQFEQFVCTMAPAAIEPKAPPLPPPTRKNCSSAIFREIWGDVEKAFAGKKKAPCIQHLFAALQQRYPGRFKDQQIHMFRKRVHEWQRKRAQEQARGRGARAGGGGVRSKS